jgi:hypothetical protein
MPTLTALFDRAIGRTTSFRRCVARIDELEARQRIVSARHAALLVYLALPESDRTDEAKQRSALNRLALHANMGADYCEPFDSKIAESTLASIRRWYRP